ncbi:MAG: adenylosuccinate lyase [Candidatus Aminicenantes bacterium]|nr:adenylosuccinate lyase [Candidatus Aminicenantes bacterium]
MIERYTVDAIRKIWDRQNLFRRWLDVELAITEVWHQMGKVPDKSMEHIRRTAAFDVDRIDEIEKEVKHDVIAFLTSVEEYVGPDSAYIHKGITSYDIVDTALSLLILESLELVLAQSRRLHRALLARARECKDLMGIGRTHGIHAEPISYGVKFLLWYEEMGRNIQRLEKARETMSVGKISGSVGTYIHFPPEGEEQALRKLGLTPCRVSSQIIQRDRHAEVLYVLAGLGTAVEKIALEIRHLQRTEVLEMEEPFTRGQKGSSSMPHKRNPVRCERISGLARLLRGHVGVALENNLLWHERDISHSSAERVIFPDAFHAACFILDEIHDIITHLVIYPENIRRNRKLTREVYFSQSVLTILLDRGLSRQKAYELVQANAMKSWTQQLGFRDLILNDPEILKICPRQDLERAFSPEPLEAGIQAIFDRFRNDSP